MPPAFRILMVVFLLCAVVFTACAPADVPTPTTMTFASVQRVEQTPTTAANRVVTSSAAFTPTDEPTQTPTSTASPSATATDIPTATPTPTHTATATHTATFALPPTNTPRWTQTPVPTIAILPTETPTLERAEHFMLGRPIARSGIDWVDRTYAYGDTQFTSLEVHHGVEFRNPNGTPVLAAAAGTVVYAGTDDIETGFPGPYRNYYGNVVILWHEFASPEGQAVFTVYGHLGRIEVELGQRVAQGASIGTVGATGIAFGAHLHFEVRVGDPMNFGATRNPELWIIPYFEHGMIAGRITQPNGTLAHGVAVKISSVDAPDRAPIYAFTYWDDSVNGDPAWGENFTVSDLPEGQYEVLVSERNGSVRFREVVTVEANRITWIEIPMERPMPNAIGVLEDAAERP